MGKLAFFKYCSFLLLVATFIVAVFTFVGIFGGNVPPGGNTARAMMVYALPLLVVADFIFLVYWLARRRWHWSVIPFITLLCCIPYIGTIFQIGIQGAEDDKENGLTIASYNVAMFNRETTGFIAQDILAQMKKKKVDILCMQEYNEASGDKRNSDSYKEFFPHMAVGQGDMVIYSRYPIKKHKKISFDSNQSAMWADVDVDGKLIRVVNVHLETTGVNRTLSKAAKQKYPGGDIKSNALLKLIYGNYTSGMVVRGYQAETVTSEAQKGLKKNQSLIVCGDFNDVPYSYTYKTMLGDLTDGFKECGSGWMYTYRGKKMFRIDYIFHDDSMEGLTYYKEDFSYSDHYPVFMKLKL